MKFIMANIIVFLYGNCSFLNRDSAFSSYKSTYRSFGHKTMVREYLESNSWKLPRFGLHYNER